MSMLTRILAPILSATFEFRSFSGALKRHGFFAAGAWAASMLVGAQLASLASLGVILPRIPWRPPLFHQSTQPAVAHMVTATMLHGP